VSTVTVAPMSLARSNPRNRVQVTLGVSVRSAMTPSATHTTTIKSVA
jgi:hypothetical protein